MSQQLNNYLKFFQTKPCCSSPNLQNWIFCYFSFEQAASFNIVQYH